MRVIVSCCGLILGLVLLVGLIGVGLGASAEAPLWQQIVFWMLTVLALSFVAMCTIAYRPRNTTVTPDSGPSEDESSELPEVEGAEQHRSQ